jgi:AcrR family transcriptional regulator
MTITASAPLGARARVRAELTREIKDAARTQLAEVGAAALSLRAVARELGMASSAVYRYFPSRDDLLTALIVDAYDAVGAAAELDESGVRRADCSGRWMATARAVREWAIAHPQEFALIYGSPVPGYQAPLDTIDPAARIPTVLFGIVNDGALAGRLHGILTDQPMPKALRTDLAALGEQVGAELTPHQIARVALGYVELVGLISFELFGHLHNVIHDYGAHFDFQMRRIIGELGLRRT